jgi:hypothetical protein
MRSILEFVLTTAATQPCGLSNTDSGPSADELQATHSGVPDSTLAFIQNASMPGHRCADIMQGAAVMRFDFSDRGCLLLALVRHRTIARGRPLSGANPDIEPTLLNAECDPKRSYARLKSRSAAPPSVTSCAISTSVRRHRRTAFWTRCPNETAQGHYARQI